VVVDRRGIDRVGVGVRTPAAALIVGGDLGWKEGDARGREDKKEERKYDVTANHSGTAGTVANERCTSRPVRLVVVFGEDGERPRPQPNPTTWSARTGRGRSRSLPFTALVVGLEEAGGDGRVLPHREPAVIVLRTGIR